jgi:hypothetical protein
MHGSAGGTSEFGYAGVALFSIYSIILLHKLHVQLVVLFSIYKPSDRRIPLPSVDK